MKLWMWPHSTDPISTHLLMTSSRPFTPYFLAPFQQMYGRNRPLLVLLKQNPCQRPLFSIPASGIFKTESSILPSLTSSCIAINVNCTNSSSTFRVSNHVALWSRLFSWSMSLSFSSAGKLFALVPTHRATRKAKAANNILLSIPCANSFFPKFDCQAYTHHGLKEDETGGLYVEVRSYVLSITGPKYK